MEFIDMMIRGPLWVAFLFATGAVFLRSQYQFFTYEQRAAQYADKTLQAYSFMLRSGEDYTEVIAAGINRHQRRLLHVGAMVLPTIELQEAKGNLTVIEIENLLNRYFFACYMRDRPRIFLVRLKLGFFRYHVFNRANAPIRARAAAWRREIREWSEIVYYLRKHLRPPEEVRYL